MEKNLPIYFGKGGAVRTIHDDDFDVGKVLDGDPPRRGSHVEPGDPNKGQDPYKWYADMTPLDEKFKDVVLGPFDKRGEALEAERQFIVDNWIKPREQHATE